MHRKSMKSILVIFAVLGMAAQSHAQSPCSSAPYYCPMDFDINTNPVYDDSGSTVTPEESFQATCCYSNCEAVQTQTGHQCPPNEVNYGQNTLAYYGAVSDLQEFQDTCCAESCSQVSMQCGAGKELISNADDVAFGDSDDQLAFDFFCCEDVQLTCAEFKNAYNDPVQGNQNLECTGTVTDNLGLEIDVTAYEVTDNTPHPFTYNEFTIDDNGEQITHELVQTNFNNACCVCNVGATISVEGFPFLIYKIPGFDPPECSSIWIEQLKGIKEATVAAGTALTSTCAVAQT